MGIINQLMQSLWNASRAIAEPVLSLPINLMLLASFIPVVFWLVGGRLSLVVKPERPYFSPVLRFLGATTKWVGLIFVLLGLIGFVVLLALLFLHQLLSGVSSADAIKQAWMIIYEPGSEHVVRWLEGCFVGLITALPIALFYIPRWERGDGFQDVEELVARFKKFNGYDPRPYIKIKKGCFIGRTISGKPIYIPWRKLHETHVQVLGMTGCGKGLSMTLIAYQCILNDECAIWFDPKFDRFTPRILQEAAMLAGREFHMINLNPQWHTQLKPNGGPQLNPLLGANSSQIVELFFAAFDLKGKGTDGDFHRGKDEDAAIEAASIAVQTAGISIPGLFRACAGIQSITDQENFWRRFRKLATLPAINTESGLNLPDAIAKRAVIYFVGSSDNEQVKMLQKMLLVRIMQIIKGRDRLEKHAPTCIVLDEFKHMLSPGALTSLGVVRDYDVHILLAHQSMGDLESYAGIEPAEAYGAVVDNTALKIIYKIGDGDYAEKLAKISGKRRTYVDSSAKQLDENGAAIGSWREDKVDHIEMSLITHLPMPSDRQDQASTGLLFGMGNAQLFFVGPIPTSGPMPEPTTANPDCDTSCGESLVELI